jgi:hypothetical protein
MENYFIRLDVKNKTVQSIKIPVEEDKTQDPMPLRGGGMTDMVTSEGCIYRAVMTTDNGVRIVRFTFD